MSVAGGDSAHLWNSCLQVCARLGTTTATVIINSSEIMAAASTQNSRQVRCVANGTWGGALTQTDYSHSGVRVRRVSVQMLMSPSGNPRKTIMAG